MTALSRWRWRLRRLVAMSPAEVGVRLTEAVTNPLRRLAARRRRPVDHPAWRAIWREPQGEPTLAAPRGALRQAGRTPVQSGFPLFTIAGLTGQLERRFFGQLLDADPVALRKTFAGRCDLDGVRRRATAALAREFDIPVWGRVTMPKEIPWHRDVPSGREWPRRFAADIDYRHDPPGDIRAAWELGRHQHLVTLAEAYFLTGERAFVEDLRVQWRHWVRENPVDVGVHWVTPMECALRLFSWLWILGFLLAAERMPESGGGLGAREEMIRLLPGAILQHAEYVRRRYARFSSANNHTLVEASALVTAGALFLPWEPAPRWFETGARLLAREVPRQVHPDGVDAEQAMHYHAFALEALLVAIAIARKNGLAMDSAIEERAERMAGFLWTLMDQRGGLPAIGDGDEGQVLAFAPGNQREARRLLILAGALFKRPEWTSAGLADDPGAAELAFWVAGETALGGRNAQMRGSERADTIGAQPPGVPPSQIFPQGGYAVFRSAGGAGVPETILTFDAGPLGLGTIAAHGHADALAVTLRVGGRAVLVDPGTGAYNANRAVRDRFRSTRVHNTLVVNDQNQAEMLGPFLWGKRPDARLECHCLTPWVDCALGSHAAYGATHRRAVLFVRPCHWVIVDWLEGRSGGPVPVAIGYQLDHAFRLEFPAAGIWNGQPGDPIGRAVARHNGEGSDLALQFWFAPPVAAGWSLIHDQGEQSPRLGEVLPAPRLRLQGHQETPLPILTVLSLDPGAMVRRRGRQLRLTAGGSEWELLLGPGEEPSATFDGQLALVETRGGGQAPVRLLALGGTRLVWHEQDLLVGRQEKGDVCHVRSFDRNCTPGS